MVQEGVTADYICRLLPLTCLALVIVAVVLEGACVRRGRDDARHLQGLTKVLAPTSAPGLRVSSSAAT